MRDPSIHRVSHRRTAPNGNAFVGQRPEGGGPAVAVLATEELAGRRAEAALEACGIGVSRVVTDVDALIDVPAVDVLVVFGGRSISARRVLLRRLRQRLPDARLLVVGPPDSRAAVRTTIEAGADGLVFDCDVERALGPTVWAISVGQVAVPATQRRELDAPTLSGREKQVLGLVVMDLSNREIASRLYVAESTVKCHLSSVFAKLGVRSRHEAVRLILDPEQRLGLGILGLSGGDRRTVEAAS